MTILISYFPCLAARFFPRCSIRPLAPLFACLRIWNCLIHQNVDSLIRWFSSMRFHWLWPRRVLFPLQSSFVVSRWLLPKHPRRVPPPTLPFHLRQSTYWLPSRMTGRHTNMGGGCVCACIRVYTHTNYLGTWCEPRCGTDTGEPEEPRSTEAQYTCRPYRCTKYICLYICWAVCFDDLG